MIPSIASTDYWTAIDYVQRVMDALWNRGDDPSGQRREALLLAVDAVDPHREDWKFNDAHYPHKKNPFNKETYVPDRAAFDVVSDEPRPDLTEQEDLATEPEVGSDE